MEWYGLKGIKKVSTSILLILALFIFSAESFAADPANQCVRLRILSAKLTIAAENSSRAVDASDKNKPSMLAELIELTRLFDAFKLLFQAGFADLGDFVEFQAKFDAAKQDIQDRVAAWKAFHDKLLEVASSCSEADKYTTDKLIACIQNQDTSASHCVDQIKKYTRVTNKLNKKLKQVVRKLGGVPAYEDLINDIANTADTLATNLTDASSANAKEKKQVKRIFKQADKLSKLSKRASIKPNVDRSLSAVFKKWLQGRKNFESCMQ